MYQVTQQLDKKDFFKCNMYYLKKFFGIRECILITLLLIAGVFLYAFADNILVLVLFFITLILVLIAAALFVITANSGYKLDYGKRGIVKQTLTFSETEFVAESLTAEDVIVFRDVHLYQKIEKIAVRRDRIYFYATAAVVYYIRAESLGDISSDAFESYLREHIPAEKFKMKTTYRIFPKRKKNDKNKIG